jgi:peptide/nickel transport system permease protein
LITAQAKGLPNRRVYLVHAVRNALIPLVTIIGMRIPRLLAGAVFLESIFGWPGMGLLFIDGVHSRDYPLIMALTLIIASAVLLANLVTDITYAIVDPRIRLAGRRD